MAVHHRKLMTDEFEDCGPFCDPVINTDGYCPISCIQSCFPTCRRPFPPPTPPPLPEPFVPAHRHHSPFKTQILHFHLVISLSILAAIFLILSCSAYYKYYRNWAYSRRGSSDPQQQQQQETLDQFLDEDLEPTVDHPIWYIRTVGLQPSAINSITICKYKRGDGLVEGTDCSVCLSEFQEDETLRLLPKCNHAFHLPCIDTWLRSHTNCPLCRAGIVTHLPASTPVQIVSSPASREGEAQVVISEGETGDGDGELRTGPEVGNGNGENSCETSKEFVVVSDNGGVDEIQPMRRSVSMDAMSASMLSIAIANAKLRGSAGNSDSEWGKPTDSSTGVVPKRVVEGNQSLLRIVGSSSSSSSMNRSLSWSGKVLLSRNSRGRNLHS